MSTRDRRRGATALLIGAIVLLVVAVGIGAAAVVVRSDTSDLQARTDSVDRRVRRLAANEVQAEDRLGTLSVRSTNLTERLVELLAASRALVDASNHAVDVANVAVDQYNRAQTGLAAAFQSAGDAAMADLEQRTAAVAAAVTAAQEALTSLQEVSGG